jgi:hypothetical protein
MSKDNNYYVKKNDQGKLLWNLLDLSIILKIVEILTFGASKYSANSWQDVENARERYWAAMMRHLQLHQAGEVYDPESKFPHLWHAFCNLYFLVWFQMKDIKNES